MKAVNSGAQHPKGDKLATAQHTFYEKLEGRRLKSINIRNNEKMKIRLNVGQYIVFAAHVIGIELPTLHPIKCIIATQQSNCLKIKTNEALKNTLS